MYEMKKHRKMRTFTERLS